MRHARPVRYFSGHVNDLVMMDVVRDMERYCLTATSMVNALFAKNRDYLPTFKHFIV
jgi:hypothetical protein